MPLAVLLENSTPLSAVERIFIVPLLYIAPPLPVVVLPIKSPVSAFITPAL